MHNSPSLPYRYSLFKRSNGRYVILWYDHNGHRRWRSTGVTTKREALKVLSQLHDQLDRTSHRISLDQFATEFLDHAKATFASKTVEIYTRLFRTLSTLFPDATLASVTGRHIETFKHHRLKLVKPVSVNQELRAMKAAFNTAIRWKLLRENPVVDVRQATVPQESKAFFAPQDFQTLLATIREDWLREIVLLAAATGMRRGEVLNLRWSDVDIDKRYLIVRTTPSYKTKSGRMRTIPLNDIALSVLGSKKPTHELVFTNNGHPIRGNWVQHLFKRYVRKAGLDDMLHFHSLRHTTASWLVQSGSTLYEVQQLLGHSSSKVTEVYSHLQPEHLQSTVARLVVNLGAK